MYDTSLDAVFIVDTNSLMITDCNKRALEIFGFKGKEGVVKIMARDLLGDKMEQRIVVQGKQSFEKKSPWYGNMDFIKKMILPFMLM